MSSHAKRNYLREICTEKILSDVFKQTDKINKQFKKFFSKSKKIAQNLFLISATLQMLKNRLLNK